MKTVRLIAALMFFAAFAVTPSFAQTGGTAPAAQGTSKVGIIDTSAFSDEKSGIQKFIAAQKQLDTEFAPRQQELRTMQTNLQSLQKQYDDLVKQSQAPNSPVSADAVQKKYDEGVALATEIKRKGEDLENAVNRRAQSVMGPIYQDISKAIQDFAKARGFTTIMDISKDDKGMILWADGAAISATTTDFIKFYNARPAGTATTAAPK